MIDIIINDRGGLTVAHDEKSLDGFTELSVDMSSGAAVLSGPDGSRDIGRLRGPLLEMVRDAMPGQMIRVSGWSFAKIGRLIIRTHD